MRKLMKLIAITAMTALLLFALMTCAAADEKIYTSPTFRLPAPTLEKAEEILDAQEEANRPELPSYGSVSLDTAPFSLIYASAVFSSS